MQNLSNFILPVICGFVSIEQTRINEHLVSLILVSRRSTERAGTRFNCRGLDDEGSVANYVETEQISRGSIPLYWRQVVNVKYQPKLVVDSNPLTSTSLRLHMSKMIAQYGNLVVVNLVNKHGYESKIGEAFSRFMRILSDARVKYVHFDFHKECRKMRWDRLSLLVDEIESDLLTQGYCFVDEKGRLLREQNSIVRTNCMDCLDRTNVFQGVLGKRAVVQQLRDLGYLGDNETMEHQPQLLNIFQVIWADNADAISIQYSGTGALKTDFTRTGKRTYEGMFNDFTNSIVRYVRNNFLDGSRQDAYDLVLGKYRRIYVHYDIYHDITLIIHFGNDFVDRPHLVKPAPVSWNQSTKPEAIEAGTFNIQMVDVEQKKAF
ncbi:hypothetical protein HDU76_008498 [Blyttiomyces sp. JEL0837]|nr:hypothetical protein HDU76_008498 [Blyttiomyces sp. JEL0837]